MARSQLIWKFSDWPGQDQAAWNRSLQLGDPFEDEERHASTLSPETLKTIAKSYGRWLSFLSSKGWFDEGMAPLERASVARLRAYVRTLLKDGNMHRTVVGRIAHLSTAMRIMTPGCDVSWIRKPDGNTIYSLLPSTQKVLRVPPAEELLDWGIRMMEAVGPEASTKTQLRAYRDGLLIALLALRARRRRSMAALRVDQEIFREADHYRVELSPSQVKTKKPDRFNLPPSMTAYIDRYLLQVRPALLQGRNCEAFWVTARGNRLSEKGMSERIAVLSRKRYGESFGPHRFRHALATTLAMADPDSPGMAAAVLGISPEVVAGHYNRAKQERAAKTFADIIDRRRAAVAKPLNSKHNNHLTP